MMSRNILKIRFRTAAKSLHIMSIFQDIFFLCPYAHTHPQAHTNIYINEDVYSWRWQVINGDQWNSVMTVLSRSDYVWRPKGRWYNDERKGQRVKIIIKSRTELTSVFIICPGFGKGLTGPSCARRNLPHTRALCNIGNENVLRFGFVRDVVSGGGWW